MCATMVLLHLIKWIEKTIKRWIACGGVNFEDRRERQKKGGGEFRKNNNRKINNQYKVVY